MYISIQILHSVLNSHIHALRLPLWVYASHTNRTRRKWWMCMRLCADCSVFIYIPLYPYPFDVLPCECVNSDSVCMGEIGWVCIMAFTWLQDVYILYGHQHGLTSFSVWNMRFIYLWHVERAHVHVSTNELQTAYVLVHRLLCSMSFVCFMDSTLNYTTNIGQMNSMTKIRNICRLLMSRWHFIYSLWIDYNVLHRIYRILHVTSQPTPYQFTHE